MAWTLVVAVVILFCASWIMLTQVYALRSGQRELIDHLERHERLFCVSLHQSGMDRAELIRAGCVGS